jgi:hypothetical protein
MNAIDAKQKIDPRTEEEEPRATLTQDHALSSEENLEEGLESSMDGSDPLSATQPGDHGDPVPSSGFPGKDPGKDGARSGRKP